MLHNTAFLVVSPHRSWRRPEQAARREGWSEKLQFSVYHVENRFASNTVDNCFTGDVSGGLCFVSFLPISPCAAQLRLWFHEIKCCCGHPNIFKALQEKLKKTYKGIGRCKTFRSRDREVCKASRLAHALMPAELLVRQCTLETNGGFPGTLFKVDGLRFNVPR